MFPTRADFLPKETEGQFLVRDAQGNLPVKLELTDDRLSFVLTNPRGALINPRGPGLRHLGLVVTQARGSDFYPAAFRAADLRPGSSVELRRDPNNPHDPNAVALYAPGATRLFGYVQRGRAPAVAHRLDNGEKLEAVSLRGPGPRRDDDSAVILIASTRDMRHLLS